MSLLRNTFRSTASLYSTINKPRYLQFAVSQRFFSTEGGQPPQAEHDSTVDQFVNASSLGFSYGRLLGITKNTMRSDVISLLEGCSLTEDDVKVNYTRLFSPDSVMVRFPTSAAFGNAARATRRLSPMYKLERVQASDWDIVKPYNGRTILLLGIPSNAVPEDVERFLSGCEYDASSIQFFNRQGFSGTKLALVRLPSQTQAMHAFITKDRGFCLNHHINVRVLH